MNNERVGIQNTRGAALLLFVVFFLAISLTLVLSIGGGVYDDLARFKDMKLGKESYYAADAAIEDAVYRYRAGMNYSATESFTVGTADVAVTRTINGKLYDFLAVGDDDSRIRRSSAQLFYGDGASFNYGLQSGNGGIKMDNTSHVFGNIFSNGSIVGTNFNFVWGDAISAGPTGRANGVHVVGNAWAHTITSSIIGLDAYYQTMTGTVVFGSTHPGSADQATATMPIDDDKVAEWEAAAEAGGVIAATDPRCSSGTYLIQSDVTIGPVKINCNVHFDKSGTDVTLAGPVWVVGNIDDTNATLRVDASLSGMSVPVIADDPANRTTGSKIDLGNSPTFVGSGAGSYVLLLSQNRSYEDGGGETAIEVSNSANGDLLLYAGHGEALLENNVSVNELTAYHIHLKNSAEVTYESGLANLLFTSGPGGGYSITSWQESE
ncbi:MAG TPA: hypothetical protein VFS75_03035 [Candidatus Paceibacterota bacterium]|nr:hypothetical protein [Candidatus Paceibacterota bacterium]